MFVDRVQIEIQGRGGNGCVSFRREVMPRRADGGDGGNGGSVIILAKTASTIFLPSPQALKAEAATMAAVTCGMASAKDMTILVRRERSSTTSKAVLKDLAQDGDSVMPPMVEREAAACHSRPPSTAPREADPVAKGAHAIILSSRSSPTSACRRAERRQEHAPVAAHGPDRRLPTIHSRPSIPTWGSSPSTRTARLSWRIFQD